MLNDFLLIFTSFCSTSFFSYYILPLLLLAFLACVPCIIRYFFRG